MSPSRDSCQEVLEASTSKFFLQDTTSERQQQQNGYFPSKKYGVYRNGEDHDGNAPQERMKSWNSLRQRNFGNRTHRFINTVDTSFSLTPPEGRRKHGEEGSPEVPSQTQHSPWKRKGQEESAMA